MKTVTVRNRSFEVYVCVKQPDKKCSWGDTIDTPDKKLMWYTIDTRTNEIWEYKAMNLGGDEADTMTLINSGCAIIDSKIYVVGGQKWSLQQDSLEEEPSKAVRIFDTKTDTWQDSKNPMSAGRAKPLLVPYVSKDGTTTKLLVFGGCKGKNDVWCESMNISTHEWTSLAPPPDVVREHGTLFGFARMGDTIVLWNQSLFCIYYVDKDKWLDNVCHVDYHFEGLRGRKFKGISTVLAYKNLIIWFDGTHLYAYDLSLREFIKSSVCSLFGTWYAPAFNSGQASYFRSFLVRSDEEKLCALWSDALPTSDVSCWMTFKTQWMPKGGLCTKPGSVFSSCIGSDLCHVLSGYQPPFKECWFENKVLDDKKFLNDLASTMYMRSYLRFLQRRDFAIPSYSPGYFRESDKFSLSADDLFEWLYLEDKTKSSVRRIMSDALNSIERTDQFPFSVEDILKWFDLEENAEKVMRKLINLDALDSFEKKGLLFDIWFQFGLSVDELLEWFPLKEKAKTAVKILIDKDPLKFN